MRVSGLTAAGDWRFGKGRAVYITKSSAIRQNVVTRLRSFTDDWFLDISEGLPWIELLGARNTELRILREIENRVLTTFGVKSIEQLAINSVDENRAVEISLSFTDIFDNEFTDTVAIT